MRPLCFVLIPLGTRADESGRAIDFDLVYEKVIGPAVEDAKLEPIREDGEQAGGLIEGPMFERFMLCDYVVADLSTANANILYQLGVRHGARPHTSVAIFANGTRLPFAAAPFQGMPYRLDGFGAPATPEKDWRALAGKLIGRRNSIKDKPLYALAGDWVRPGIARVKTDIFRDEIAYSPVYKEKLRLARNAGAAAVASIQSELNLKDADPAIVIDLFLSYRAVKDWKAMVDLVPRMSPVVARTVLVREQLGFALNRLGRRDEAEQMLHELIDTHGPSSETNSLLGRVQKDRWEEALNAGETAAARGHLRNAIQTYLSGFEADWRDAYPGINAVTLMELENPIDVRQAELIPVVRYAVLRRLAGKQPDYWDYATLLELCVLASDREAAQQALSDALAAIREPWEPETTARNLRLIQRAREARNSDAGWIAALAADLEGGGGPEAG